MFRKYGLLGIVMILFVEINFLLKIQPFANWYFPIVWFGYIFVLDALIYKVQKTSLISNKPWLFLGLLIASAVFWWLFELLNLVAGNWSYGVKGIDGLGHVLKKTLAFSTVLPAFFETVEWIRVHHLFNNIKLHKHHHISKTFIHTMLFFGILSFILPLFLPTFFYPLLWVAFFLLLDPINYLHHQPSIIGHLKDGKLAVPLTLLLAGIICGFLWEFWNYWAIGKWTYDIPFLGFFKIFEMPILGYLGYFPFAFELYAMFFFIRSLFLKTERLLI